VSDCDIWLISSSLSRPASHNAEREQALKLLRAFLDVPQGITFMTQGIVKAIVAIAEMGVQGEDRLSGIAVETLAEICIPFHV
jgi:rapamycin-insensitive companion of mTOR